MSDNELREYLDFAKELALEAGKVMMKYFASENLSTVIKSDQTKVTVADTKINDMVIDEVAKHFPGHSVLGEEASNKKQSEFLWVCDPIDGTLPYSHGIPISTFNLALLKDGQPIVAVQNDPFTKRLLWASKNRGSFQNGKKLQVTGRFIGKPTVDCEIYANERNIFNDPNAESEIWRALLKEGFVPMKLISIAVSGGLVASGELAASVFSVRHNYEAATVSLLVTEAGGEFTSLFGEKGRLDGEVNGFIAAPKNVHIQLLDLVKPIAEKYRVT